MPADQLKAAARAARPRTKKAAPVVAAHTAPQPPGAPDMFQPVRPRRAFEIVCDQIRRQFAEGRLKPGDRLPPERELAATFNVNRTVLREALRSLEMAGVIRTETGLAGGVFVSEASSGTMVRAVHDMLSLRQVSTSSLGEARVMLMTMAIRLASERGEPADFDAIEADIARLEKLAADGTLARPTADLVRFYPLIAAATKNEVVVMLVEALSDIQAALLARMEPEVLPGFLKVRRSVLRHLRARNADKAIDVLGRHLAHMSQYMESQQRLRITD